MSLELSVSTGGLVFEVAPELSAEQASALLRPVLEENRYPVESCLAIGALGFQISCAGLLLWFNAENRSYAAPRMRVTAQQLAGDEATPAREAGTETMVSR